MALQPKLIACGNSVATFAMAVRFLTGPAVMAVAAIAIGLRGDLLRVAIVQVKILSFFGYNHFSFNNTMKNVNMFWYGLFRLHYPKELCPLCLQRSTMFILLF